MQYRIRIAGRILQSSDIRTLLKRAVEIRRTIMPSSRQAHQAPHNLALCLGESNCTKKMQNEQSLVLTTS